jgi:hypothetical protein
MIKKSSIVILIAVSLLSLALAAPPNSPPHRVFGDIDNANGEASVDVSFRYNGESILSSRSDDSGYYDVDIPYNSDYEGEKLELFVDGSSTGETVIYSSGEVSEIDYTVQNQESDQQPQSSGGGSGGGGFAQPTNTTETSENTTDNSTSKNRAEIRDNETETNQTFEDEEDAENVDSIDGQENSTERNQAQEESSNGNIMTGLFTAQPSETLTNFFGGIVNWFGSLF